MRRLDWIEALSAESRPAVMQEDLLAGRSKDPEGPPDLPAEEKYPVIIGSDLIYEVKKPDLLASFGN